MDNSSRTERTTPNHRHIVTFETSFEALSHVQPSQRLQAIVTITPQTATGAFLLHSLALPSKSVSKLVGGSSQLCLANNVPLQAFVPPASKAVSHPLPFPWRDILIEIRVASFMHISYRGSLFCCISLQPRLGDGALCNTS